MGGHLKAVPDPVPGAGAAPTFLTPIEVSELTGHTADELALPRFGDTSDDFPLGIWFNGEMRYNPAAVRAWMRRRS